MMPLLLSSNPAILLDSYDAPTLLPPGEGEEKKRSRTMELAALSGGALALAIIYNKVLFLVRVLITIALTPPIARFLTTRKLIKTHI